jgi:hypothetical protein
MPNNIRIKVIFRRVHVIKDADAVGSGEFFFDSTVDGQAVGNRHVFDAVEGQNIILPQPLWSKVVDVTNKDHIVVFFHGKDEDVFSDDDLGSVRHTLRAPWAEREFSQRTEFYTLVWGVEIELGGTFGHHAPDEVYACRERNGSVDCTTISGVVIPARLEFHPVRPVPATASLPPRPALPAGTAELAVNNLAAGTNVTTASDINIIPNPPVIPILTAAEANAQTATRIEFTYYRPSTLHFTDNDPRLEWTVVPVTAGAAVSFLGQPRGLKVMVFGTTAGEVRFEVRFRGALFATYRALVRPLKKVPCRFNILNGPTAASQPRSTPADVQNHLTIANRYLRQLALELFLDTNVTRTNGATATTIPGIFRIRVAAGTTRNVVSSTTMTATRLNFRPNVMNFAYIHSDTAGNLGAATDFPNSTIAPAAAGGRPTVTDNGTPSDSWALPSGVLPDAAAGLVTLQLISGIQRAGFPTLFAMYVTDAHGDPTQAAVQQNIANTIVHEFCHILNLGHRVEGAAPVTPANPTGLVANGIFFDGLNHPPGENLMHFNNPGTIAQDLDIVQAKAARKSPLIPAPPDP